MGAWDKAHKKISDFKFLPVCLHNASQMTKASCYPHTSTAYTLTLKEVTDTANITVLWRSHDCGGSRSSLSQSGNTWTYQGDFRQGQEEMMWLVKLTSVTSSRDTKLRVVTSFGNTVGEITSTADFKVGELLSCHIFLHKQFVPLKSHSIQLVLQLLIHHQKTHKVQILC